MPTTALSSRDDLLFRDECFRIYGAIFEVYREHGCGFAEAVYQESLAIEFELQKIPFVAQPELSLAYKQHQLRQTYRPDFVCYGSIILELKALKGTSPEHEAQVLNYLKASGLKLALLVNFGKCPKASIQRIVL